MINVGTQPGVVTGSMVTALMAGNVGAIACGDGSGAMFDETACEGNGFVNGDRLARYHMLTSGPGGGSAGGVTGAGGPAAPAGAGSPEGPGDPKSFLERTATPQGEIDLLSDAMEKDEDGNHINEDGIRWMEMVRLGMAGDETYAKLIDRPLVKVLRTMTSGVMVPEVDNFTSDERTPWGGTRIAAEMKKGLGMWKPGLVVGESWEISGHKRFPNMFRFNYSGSDLDVDVRTLERMFSTNLYGALAANNEITEMPFLVKLLNSGGWEEYKEELMAILDELDEREGAAEWRKEIGIPVSLVGLVSKNYDEIHRGLSRLEELVKGDYPEMDHLKRLHQEMLTKNLSVQVHPPSDYKGLRKGEHSKTEAWIIVDAEPGAVIYLGLKEGVTKEQFERTLEAGGDGTEHLNAVPVKKDDPIFIPAGTVHAIGAGITLVEPQEPSDTTLRVYDYGRLGKDGRPREIHVQRAMEVIDFEGLRGEAAVAAFRHEPKASSASSADKPMVETLVDEDLFRATRFDFMKNEVYEGEAEGFVGYVVLEGAVVVEAEHVGSEPTEILKGQSFMVPAAVGKYRIVASSHGSVLIGVSQAG